MTPAARQAALARVKALGDGIQVLEKELAGPAPQRFSPYGGRRPPYNRAGPRRIGNLEQRQAPARGSLVFRVDWPHGLSLDLRDTQRAALFLAVD